MTPPTPTKLDLKKDAGLTIVWSDGRVSEFTLATLRSQCPCAACRDHRAKQKKSTSRLTVLPGNYSGQLEVVDAKLVGNYAVRLIWSDGHDTGIYSFQYLREIEPKG